MGYHVYMPLAVVPAARVTVFNDFMERNGYGPGFCPTKNRNGVIGITDDAATKTPTHYYITASGDTGLVAAMKEGVKKANKNLPDLEKGLFRERFRKGRAKIKKILENAQLKRKEAEADAEDDVTQDVIKPVT